MIDRSTPRFILQLIMLPILCLGTAVSREANSEVHATG
jgi:hypothetical protein